MLSSAFHAFTFLASLIMLLPLGTGAVQATDAPFGSAAPVATVTLQSLLEEMVDRDQNARWPEPAFTVRQASSYDRHQIAPDQSGWFANEDSSHYIRMETHNGHEERVMLDAEGPGAIVRFFFTNAGSRAARIRVYLDGADIPSVEWPTSDLMNGGLEIGAPLRAPHPPPLNHGGATLYLPLPYARHCKVTLEENDPAHAGNRYYHINYRTYGSGTIVKSFTKADLTAVRPLLDRVNQLLSNPPAPTTTTHVSLDRTLAPGTEAIIDLPNGTFAVRQLELSVGSSLSEAAREQALRSVILRAAFDDEPESIWCPVGDFAGSGTGGRPLASWYRTVNENGTSVCRWTMPYHKQGRFTLQNLSGQAVPVKIVARLAVWDWSERSLYFHCDWRQQVQIPSRPLQDWNFDTITGRGVLVGDVLSVFNPLPSWYGEGDERIWVDGESFPSHVGTGTEDYYNASWAPNPVYQTPFANHPRIDDPLSQGHNVYTRSRNLDAVPFEQSMRFDFEISTWKESRVDYTATTYWYGAPGARSRMLPELMEACRPVPVLPSPMVIQGAIECESLPIAAYSPGLVVEPQDMRWSDTGTWSAHSHLLIRGKKAGDYIELEIPVSGKAHHRMTLYATQANDYGILRFSVNGHPVTAEFDGYAPTPTVSRPISLGVFPPVKGKLRLRIELVGTNPHSVGDRYLAALDALLVSE